MIAFIETLKDDTCTPKPAKLNAWVHLKVSYETDTVSRSRSFLFHSYAYAQSISPAILRFALGCHDVTRT